MSFASFILNKATKSAADAEIMARRRADGRTGEGKRPPRKRGARTLWTPERDALLIELAAKLDGADVAERMGVSYNAAKCRAHRIGIGFHKSKGLYHKWTTIMFAQVKELHGKGFTSVEIGKAMGMSENQIRGAINRMGLTGRRKKWDGDMEFTVARWHNFKDNELLCNALGLKESSIRARYMRLSRQKRLDDLRYSTEHKDMLVEYCNKYGIKVPSLPKR